MFKTDIAPIWGKANLRISDSARAELVRLMGEIAPVQAVAHVSWVIDVMRPEGDGFTHSGPGWGVGFYSRGQVPAESVADIAGIPFVFGAEDARRLNGAILDVVEGRFVVTEHAI